MTENKTLAECLHKYDDESLKAYGAEYGLAFEKEGRDAVCSALSEALLAEKVLEKRLGILDDASWLGLKTICSGNKIEDEDIIDHLDGLDLIYGSVQDHIWNVPQEVQQAMQIENESWNKERRSRVWLMECLSVIQHYWADADVDTMQKLYQKNTEADAYADLKKLFAQIPVSETTCVMIGDSFVIRGWRTSEVFAGYREKQKKYTFYIPEVDEVKDLYTNDYAAQEKYGQSVRTWFLQNGAEKDDLELLMHEMWNDMNYGHSEKDIVKEAESMIVYDNKTEQEQFRQMMHAWYLHARRMDLRGHCMAEERK